MLKAQILAAIDGHSSVEQIGRKIAQQHGLGKPETIHAVKRILTEVWEGKREKASGWSM